MDLNEFNSAISLAESKIACLNAQIIRISDMRWAYPDGSYFTNAHMQIENLRNQINAEYAKITQLRREFYGRSR